MNVRSRQRRFEREEAERLLAIQIERQAADEIKLHGRRLTIKDFASPGDIAVMDDLMKEL